MNLQSLSMLIYAVLLFQFYISYCKNECHGNTESLPCKCHIGKYECLYFNCNWEFSKCSDSVDTDFPTYQPTPQPEKQIQTDFQTYQPTPEPTPTDLDYQTLECGDSINNKYEGKDIIFELNILYDTTMVEINACNSNYDTRLKLFDGLDEDLPIFNDDNSCGNEYDSSLIEIPNGLNAGIYYLLLSADNGLHHQHGEYELHLFCETEFENQESNFIQNQKTECESNCDAFNVQMLYYGPLSDYDTEKIYYDKIDTNNRRRRMQPVSDFLLAATSNQLTSKRLRKMQDDHHEHYGYYYDMNYNYDYPRYRQAIGFKTASPAASVNGKAASHAASVNGNTASPAASVNGNTASPTADVNGITTSTAVNGTTASPTASVNGNTTSTAASVNGITTSTAASANGTAASVNGNPRRMVDNNVTTTTTDDIMCYTYRVERLFNTGICSDKLNSIVLGVCNMDYNRINYKDLDELIVKEYGGDLYNGYNNFGINEIIGVKIDVPVDENIEFTLCMRGVNQKGNVSHNVQFERGIKRAYVCHDEMNDGLPCLDRSYRNNNGQDTIDVSVPEKEDFGNPKHSPESKTFARILRAVLIIALSVMVMVSAVYVFINNKAKTSKKKDKSNTQIDWAEINVSDTNTFSDTTEDVNDDKDPLDSEDIIYNKILSPASASTNKEENGKLLNNTNMIEAPIDENDNIADLKENLFDLNKKFLNNQNDNNNNNNMRHNRSSVSSNMSENDGCTILAVYSEYNHFENGNVSDDGYWNSRNADMFSNDEISPK